MTSALSSCQPTHQACVGYDGLYHIKMGDSYGAAGTIFFQFVVAQLIYAEKYNLLPFVHLNNYSFLVYDDNVHAVDGDSGVDIKVLDRTVQVSTLQDPRWRRALYPGPPKTVEQKQRHGQVDPTKTYHFEGDGVWYHYFRPISEFCPGDRSCMKLPYVTMEAAQISPGLHLYAPWAPKIWRYGPLPAFVGQPHIPLTTWLTPQRIQGHDAVRKYYEFQPWMLQQSQLRPLVVHPGSSRTISTREKRTRNEENGGNSIYDLSVCLGIHVRWSDKGASRRKLSLHEYFPFVQAYMDQFEKNSGTTEKGPQPCIFLATDAPQVITYVQNHWPSSYRLALITSRATIRSPNETAVFNLASHHETNKEVLVDIMDLAYCRFLLHGNSAVSESAIYLNGFNLIYQSVNIEDPQHPWTPHTFGRLVHDVVITGNVTADYWKNIYQPSLAWWEQAGSLLPRDEVSYCDDGVESDGFLNISLQLDYKSQTAVEPMYSLSLSKLITRLFLDFANQLYSAKLHNLIPLVYDNQIFHWFERISTSDPLHGSVCLEAQPKRNNAITMSPDNLMSNDTRVIWPSWRFFQKQKHGFTNLTYQGWFQKIRQEASQALRSFLKFRPYLLVQARHVVSLPATSKNASRQASYPRQETNLSRCLGLHIPDPGYKRNPKLKEWVQKKYPMAKYKAYVDAYQEAGGKCIYLSTDSHSIWKEWISGSALSHPLMAQTSESREALPKLDQVDDNEVGGRRSIKVYGQSEAVRNREQIPAHYMESSVSRLVSEALVDIWNLASCEMVIHGSHPISDAALFWNSNKLSFHVQDSDPNNFPYLKIS